MWFFSIYSFSPFVPFSPLEAARRKINQEFVGDDDDDDDAATRIRNTLQICLDLLKLPPQKIRPKQNHKYEHSRNEKSEKYLFYVTWPKRVWCHKKAYDSTVSSPMLCVCALAHRNMNVLHSPSFEFKYIILLCKDSCWNIPQCPQRIAWDPFFSIPQIECAGVWNTRTLNHTQEKHFYSMSPHSTEMRRKKTKYIGNRIIESIKRVHKYYFGKINSSIPSNF